MDDERRRDRRALARQERQSDREEDEGLTMAQLLDLQTVELSQVRRGAVVEGEVVYIDSDDVLVDIGLKSEGVVPSRELGNPAEDLGRPLEVGDRILVSVIQPDDEGPAVLSYRRARRERRWRQMEDMIRSGEVLEVPVVDHNRGGVVVDLGLRGFVPISQLTSLRREGDQAESRERLVQRLAELVGSKIHVKVVEVDRRRNRLILSERLADRALRAQRRDELFGELEPGQIREGTVSNLASFGAFVDLGGADGLAHISELSWDHVNHPSDVLTPGQSVSVYVLSVDREEHRIALSLKRVEDDPWETVEEQYPPGEDVTGVVLRQSNYGVFVHVDEGVEGYLHPSDTDPADAAFLEEGRALPFRVLHIDYERRRLRLLPAFEHLDEQGEVVPESYEGTYAPPDEEAAEDDTGSDTAE
jgi:small subunit ribosomal protein S1